MVKTKLMDSPHFPGCHLLSVTDPNTGFRMFIRKPDGTYWKAIGDLSFSHTSLGFEDEIADEKQIELLENAFDEWQRTEYGLTN